MGQIAPDALRCNCDVWGGWGWGRFRSLLQKVIKGQGERKENILHELLTTAMLSASGSALQSLCKESKGPRMRWSADFGAERGNAEVSIWRED